MQECSVVLKIRVGRLFSAGMRIMSLRSRRCYLSDPSIASHPDDESEKFRERPRMRFASQLPTPPARPINSCQERLSFLRHNNIMTTSSNLGEHPPIRLERYVDSCQHGLPHRRRRAAERPPRPRRNLGAVTVDRRCEVEIGVHLGDLSSDRAREVLQSVCVEMGQRGAS